MTDDERNNLIESAFSFEAVTSAAEHGERAAQTILAIADHDPDKLDWIVSAMQEIAAVTWAPGNIAPEHLRLELAYKMARQQPPYATRQQRRAARAFLDWLGEVFPKTRAS
jgi:hypothetical protein